MVRLPERSLSKEDHPVETFILDRPDEPFGMGVQVWRTGWQANDLDAGTLQQISEGSGVLRIAVETDKSLVGPSDLDTTRRQFDQEENVRT